MVPKGSNQGTLCSSQHSQQQVQGCNYEALDKSSSNTLKRNPKMELNKTDLLKLLSYLEGELQARDIVIATLKRDSFAAAEARVDEAEIRSIANQQMATLDNLVIQQRRSQMRLARILRDAEERHRKELELERQAKKKQEKELKRVSDILEEERNRQKQIVLLLLAERKKLIMKYVEERKRSEDLAQILTEEKGRIDSMAEGLEEESKKSLQMEAELEKQLAQFDTERQQLKAAVAKEEKRVKDLEVELEKAKGEADALKKQLAEAHQVAMFQAGTASVSPPRMVLQRPGIAGTPPQPPAKPAVIPPQTSPRPTPAAQPPTGVPLTPPKVGTWGQPGTAHADGSISPPPAAAGTPMISSVAKVTAVGPEKRSQQQAQVVQVTPRVSLSASPGTKVFTTTQGGKVTFHVTTNTGLPAGATQPPAPESQTKKPAPPGRGIPPPVPPNKPVVPPKKEAVSAAVRRPDSATDGLSAEGKSQKASGGQGAKFGISIAKDKGGELVDGRRDPQVGAGSHIDARSGPAPASNPTGLHESPATSSGHGFEMLDPELADFQQILISMAADQTVKIDTNSTITSTTNEVKKPEIVFICATISVNIERPQINQEWLDINTEEIWFYIMVPPLQSLIPLQKNYGCICERGC
ncbi:hypothetical protein C0J52_04543 [Blattella germanica]|nr:hypothetical protein C0J52_04543 [Blattella germanica]